MRCKLCQKSFRATTPGAAGVHNWEKGHCARCHYLRDLGPKKSYRYNSTNRQYPKRGTITSELRSIPKPIRKYGKRLARNLLRYKPRE